MFHHPFSLMQFKVELWRVVGLEGEVDISDGQLVFAQVNPDGGPVGEPQGQVVVGGGVRRPVGLGELKALIVEGQGVVGVALSVGQVALLSESAGQLVVLGVGHGVKLQLGTELCLGKFCQQLQSAMITKKNRYFKEYKSKKR